MMMMMNMIRYIVNVVVVLLLVSSLSSILIMNDTTILPIILPPVSCVLQHYAMDIVSFQSPTTSTSTTTTTKRTINNQIYKTMLVSHSMFGIVPPTMKEYNNNEISPYILSYPPDDTNDPLLCIQPTPEQIEQQLQQQKQKQQQSYIMFIPRGNCTFMTKVYHAQLLGANAVIIYGTLESRYIYNTTTTTTIESSSNSDNESSDSNNNDNNNMQNPYTKSILQFPQEYYDYDCSNGRSIIPLNQELILLPYYQSDMNDPLLITDRSSSYSNNNNNLCIQYTDDDDATTTTTRTKKYNSYFQSHCSSQQCVITGKNITKTTTTKHDDKDSTSTTSTYYYGEACCAWDLPIYLYPDHDTINNNNSNNNNNSTTSTITSTNNNNNNNNNIERSITIPSGYITVQQMMELKQFIIQFESNFPVILPSSTSSTTTTLLGIRFYQRYRPQYNYSAILIWLLGCIVATIASYYSANEYHIMIQQQQHNNNKMNNNISNKSKQQQQQQKSEVPTTTMDETNPLTTATTTDQQQQQQSTSSTSNTNNNNNNEEVLELTAMHAVGFVIMASSSLLILFYFQIYSFVKVMYTIGCSTAITQIIILPIYHYIVQKQRNIRDLIVYRTNTEDFGDITIRDILTHIIGFTLGISWLVLSLTIPKPETITYYWVMQNIFGTCMCISFVKVIRLNSIRVAAILLIVAFFYDIFFVFITPHLFHGKSVMITVATSGGPPKADELWCEKYPHDPNCQGGNPLPMLLAIPKLFDYTGGSSLLGLGDIVLPGLLLSFAARYDAAKILVGVMNGGRISQQTYSCPEQQCCTSILPKKCGSILCSGGYFGPLIVAYAIGLAMANTAVYVMHMGQPALLYLVPCCLGTIVYIGYRKNELQQLWDGPRVLQTADNILSNNNNSQSSISPQNNDMRNNHNNHNLHTPIPLDDDGYGDDALAVPPSAVDDDDNNNNNNINNNNNTK